ncbi:helix-turn-helix transcriptional regulator [Clostridium tyrobutyricum]|uniref:helix-turn-helix domain-containing protein n=1 Tax=Clostridium tyrobutyricum TaxID=1519 RepID=UPI001C3811AD|nr:helix-turn-helix transcriptional regulator [Clostridium tyrobutyricum]MBV4430718.1 helix-turn-helix transcriptional regulator [Clostridium tyrobutyricum]
MTIGDSIRKIAENKNMSIYQVMKKSKVSNGQLYDIVNNKVTNPTVDTVKKIAKALEVSTSDLIEPEETKEVV